MQEYNERRNKKLINNFLLVDRPHYWVTSSRPSNFGDPLDVRPRLTTGSMRTGTYFLTIR